MEEIALVLIFLLFFAADAVHNTHGFLHDVSRPTCEEVGRKAS